MDNSKHFTIWVTTMEEAEEAADTLDLYMDRYGSGPNTFRVAIFPDNYCPFDVCYLPDGAAEQIKHLYYVR